MALPQGPVIDSALPSTDAPATSHPRPAAARCLILQTTRVWSFSLERPFATPMRRAPTHLACANEPLHRSIPNDPSPTPGQRLERSAGGHTSHSGRSPTDRGLHRIRPPVDLLRPTALDVGVESALDLSGRATAPPSSADSPPSRLPLPSSPARGALGGHLPSRSTPMRR